MAKRRKPRRKFQLVQSIEEIQEILFKHLQGSKKTWRGVNVDFKLPDGTKVTAGAPEEGLSAIKSASDIQIYREDVVSRLGEQRKASLKIPPDLKKYIEAWYGYDALKRYEEWVKGGKNRLEVIRKEIIEELRSRRANPETLKVTDSHLLNIGEEGRRVPVKGSPGYDPFEGAKYGWDNEGKLTITPKAPPVEGGSLRAPGTHQSFLENLKENIQRGATPAAALDDLRNLGLPTSWLEDFYNYMLLRRSALGETSDLLNMQPDLTNRDVVDLVQGNRTADQIIIERLDREWFEKSWGDLESTANKLNKLPAELREQFLENRYKDEITRGVKGEILPTGLEGSVPKIRDSQFRTDIDNIAVNTDPYTEAGLLTELPVEPENIALTQDEITDLQGWERDLTEGPDKYTVDPDAKSNIDIPDELPSRKAGFRPTVKGLTIGGVASTIAGEAGYAGLNPETGYHAGVIASGEGDISNVKGAAAGAGKAFGWGMGFNLASKALMRGGAAKTAGKFVPFLGTPLLLYGIYETADAFTKGYTGKGITERIKEVDYQGIIDDVYSDNNSIFKRGKKQDTANLTTM